MNRLSGIIEINPIYHKSTKDAIILFLDVDLQVWRKNIEWQILSLNNIENVLSKIGNIVKKQNDNNNDITKYRNYKFSLSHNIVS